MEKVHGIEINLRTFKRRLAQNVIKKASTNISDETICSITEWEVKGPSSLKGYGNIWNKLRVIYGITVLRDFFLRTLFQFGLTIAPIQNTGDRVM